MSQVPLHAVDVRQPQRGKSLAEVRVIWPPGTLRQPVDLGRRVIGLYDRAVLAVGRRGAAAAGDDERRHHRDRRDQNRTADHPGPGRHTAAARPGAAPAAVTRDALARAQAFGAVLVRALLLSLAHRRWTIDSDTDGPRRSRTPRRAVLPVLRTAARKLLRSTDRGRSRLVRAVFGMFPGRAR